MGLVDYSESDSGSEAEAPAKLPAKVSSNATRKPSQKTVNRSNQGKILLDLPQISTETIPTAESGPPAKRAKTTGGGLFSGFNSLLPPPKNANKPTNSTSSWGTSSTSLKTSAAAGFSRDANGTDGFSGSPGAPSSSGTSAVPSIPSDQKPAEEVKLVGKPLMFKPLSVSRGNTKKKSGKAGGVGGKLVKSVGIPQANGGSRDDNSKEERSNALPPKRVSLFSMHTEEGQGHLPEVPSSYEPMFQPEITMQEDEVTFSGIPRQSQDNTSLPSLNNTESLESIAKDLNLSAAERRELFGRSNNGGPFVGSNRTAEKVINFNMDKEYEYNEGVRSAGDQQMHNPVRAIQSGKHSLRQLVQNVQNQKDALEDSFAKGRANRDEASSKYGWH